MDKIFLPKSSAAVKDDTTSGVKRKADRNSETLIKRTRLSESEDPTASEEYVSARGVKRKASEHGEEEPTKKKEKKGRPDLNLFDKESGSPEDSGIESCNTSVEDVRVGKRKAAADDEGPKTKKKRMEKSVDALRAEFEANYKQQDQLGQGGCGTVFVGYRKADNLPVAIKHIPKDRILCKHVDETGKQLPSEIAIMLKLANKTRRSVRMSAPVSLLDWYDLDQELILVLERPIPAEDLLQYLYGNGGSLEEQEAKVIVSVDHGNFVFTKVIVLMDQEPVVEAVKQLIILKQLLDAAIDLEKKLIFHRDIKPENILIETSSDVLRVRLIDFGLSCFVKTGGCSCILYGTPDFLPPELFSLGSYRAGPTTVWQMGAVLFEMLHRGVAFKTTEFMGNRLIISETLSENCRHFFRRCFVTDPKQRPTLEELRIHPWLKNTNTTHRHTRTLTQTCHVNSNSALEGKRGELHRHSVCLDI